jgi:shikimate kinase
MYKYIIDPHTSVAYNGYLDYIKENNVDNHFVIVSTAHPSKFNNIIENTIIREGVISKKLEIIKNKPVEKYLINNTYDDFVKILQKISSNNLSITFIGMPGAGKSYISNILSKEYNIKLIELDQIIERKYNMTLPEIIKIYGEAKFKIIEEQAILDIDFSEQNIISTGGSVVYYEKGMEYLNNNNNIIVYLDTNYDTLKIRTEDFTNRGIVFNKQTPEELYRERNILYNKYSQIKVDFSNKDNDFICNMFRFLK